MVPGESLCRQWWVGAFLGGLVVTACGRAPSSRLEVLEVPAPVRGASALPQVVRAGGGEAVLSWVEEAEQGSAGATLHAVAWTDDGFGSSLRIAAGDDWFVNWADVPAVGRHGEVWIASYLQRTGGESYDYAVRVVQSRDDGATFGAPITLHDDDGAGEHGFVTWVPVAEGFAAVWLDGRASGGHGADGGAMQLRTRRVALDGERSPELLLDERVCDCCPTDAVRLGNDLLVAYRDRGEDERRDIRVVRVTEDERVVPLLDTSDGWIVPGCPVNGPALAADGDRVALAWTTHGAAHEPRVMVTVSNDRGGSFGAPLRLGGTDVHGRVDVVFDVDGRVVVSFLEARGDGAVWRVGRLDAAGRRADLTDVAGVGGGRETGVARLARIGADVFLVFTSRAETAAPAALAVRRLVWE